MHRHMDWVPNLVQRNMQTISLCIMGPNKHRVKSAQIEKESLALTWACERFCDYLIGKPFHMLTDYKPLVSLLSSKPLDSLPLRVQCFRMRLMRFTYIISHVPGKDLTVADILSRAPTYLLTYFRGHTI